MAARDWIGSIIFVETLHANANRVVLEYISIVRRRACCAALVMASASSRMMILCLYFFGMMRSVKDLYGLQVCNK